MIIDLDIQILQELGMRRYMSMSFLRHYFSASSRSNLAKRLKMMIDCELIGRKFGFEPITHQNEYVYFLKKQGAEVLLARSNKFGAEEQIEIPKGHNVITHDLATSLFLYLWELECQHYLGTLINKWGIQSRRFEIVSRFKREGFYPDATIEIQSSAINRASLFLLEVDNGTENKLQIKEKLSLYHDYLNKNNACLLFLLVAHSEQRLSFLLRLANEMQKNERVFACTLLEANSFGIFSNIWTQPKNIFRTTFVDKKRIQIVRFSDLSERDRCFLPL